MFVTVFFSTYNQKDRAVATLNDLIDQDYPKHLYEVVANDDGSTDGTADALERRLLRSRTETAVKIIRSRHEKDYWHSRRWNECIAAASSVPSSVTLVSGIGRDELLEVVRDQAEELGWDFLALPHDTKVQRIPAHLFIQIDDVRVRPDFISQHVSLHTDWGLYDCNVPLVVCGAKFEDFGPEPRWDTHLCRRSKYATWEEPVEVSFREGWGCGLSYTKQTLDRLMYVPGTVRLHKDPYDLPFDERMIGWGWQDIEFCYRLHLLGARFVYSQAAGVYHQKHDNDDRFEGGRTQIVKRGYTDNLLFFRAKHGVDPREVALPGGENDDNAITVP